MRGLILGVAASLLIAGAAHARPASSHYHGYVSDRSVTECQDAQLAACNREFGSCYRDTIGQTRKVGYQDSEVNVSMLCTRFTRPGVTVYSVAVTADAAYGSVHDIVVRMKEFVQRQFRN